MLAAMGLDPNFAYYAYVLRDTAGQALYVGVSRNPEQRRKAHQSTWWGQKIATMEVLEEFPPGHDCVTAEKQIIAALRPTHNKNQGGDGRLPTTGAGVLRNGKARYLLKADPEDLARWKVAATEAKMTFAAYVRMALDRAARLAP